MATVPLSSVQDVLTPREVGGVPGVTGLGVGTARLGAFWQGRGVREGARTLEAALDLGVTLVDTADVYARGIAERLVGRAVATRPEAVVMTKAGLLKTPQAWVAASRATGTRPSPSGLKASAAAGRCFHPGYLRWALEGSLRRLRMERIPVYLLHEPELSDVQDPQVVEAMTGFVREGLIGAWGVSTPDPQVAVAALDLPGTPWVQALAGPGHAALADRLAEHPRRGQAVLVGIGALGDGALVPELSERTGLPGSDVVASLLDRAIVRMRPDAVLLGMSTAEHAVRNLARLRAGAPLLDGPALERLLTPGEEPTA